ncbi:MAG: transglutaminase-like domain-containing protein, partial [Flammeovirgaceae bacterium]
MENDQTDIAEKVKEITKDATTDKEKVSAIYYWVQDNIRYIAFEDGIAGFKPDACQNVYNKKYGDCKGMANLTKEMLKIAGYDARLVWMGTRRLAYDYSIPSLAVDNHMICAVFLDDEVYYLDPTEKYGAFGEYAERIQGRPVLIEDGENYLLKEIPKATLEGNATKTTMSVELNNDDLAGKITHIYKGESKSSLLYGLNSIENDRKEDALKYYLNSGDNNYKIDQLNMPDLELRDGDIELAYDITLKNKTSSFDNDIYIELDAFKEFEQFKMEDDRKNDYQFSYKILIDTEIELTIPEGYAVTYLPEKLLIDKDHYNFSLQYEKKNGKLIYKKKLALKNTVLPKQEFKTWNENIKQLKAFYAEQVTLTKQ